MTDGVDRLNYIKPELMTSSERTQFINAAFDRSTTGKKITIGVNKTVPLSPGTYHWTEGTTDGVIQYVGSGTGIIYNVGTGSVFSVQGVQNITNVGIEDVILTYYPERTAIGAPLIRVITATGAAQSINIPFAGAWSIIQTTAANVFVRNITGSGWASFVIACTIGDKFTISQTAIL